MPHTVRIKNTGLRGVTVADTKISFIDGDRGILIYRGFRIEDLAAHATFMEVAYLLLKGALPDNRELATFSDNVKRARGLPRHVEKSLKCCPQNAKPMDVLQASIPMLAMADPDFSSEDKDAHIRMATRLIARLPVVIAAWDRIRKGQDIIHPDDNLSHAENFLYMLHGSSPEQTMARALDVCLVLHADHTFNASTFASRQVASTRAHMYSAIAAAIGALSGSLHGGANTEVIKMLLELKNERNINRWVKSRLDKGERIMGMGHAVYKTTDPRATFLKKMAKELSELTGNQDLYNVSLRVEEAALQEFEKRGKSTIKPNVDFYSAPVYYMMGIPPDLMTAIFAMSRVAGWCAHVIEEKFGEAQGKPALYRPQADYVGEYCGLMGCTYKPRRKGN